MKLGNLTRHTVAAPLAALTLVAGGSIALAASGGGEPAPQAIEHRQVAKPTAEPTVKPTADPANEPKPEASPSPSLTGLCTAYQAGGYAASTKNGHVNPAWSALESAAGGADGVDAYCEDRLATEADDADEPKADKPARGPKPANAHRGGAGGDDDDADAIDNDDAGDSDDADDVDADADDDDGGSRGEGRGRH